MMMKFVRVLNVVVVYIGTENCGNVQIVTTQKKIRKSCFVRVNDIFGERQHFGLLHPLSA